MQNYQNPVYPAAVRSRSLPRSTVIALVPSERLALGLILLLALALRLWGLGFGLPYVIQPDEPSVEMRALHMWLAADPNPHYFIYPSLYYDLQAIWAALVGHVAGLVTPDVLRHPLLHLPLFYLAGRALTALMGTLTVLVTYLVGRALYPRGQAGGRALGLSAALFLAVAAQHVQQSHYITVDAPTALFTALAAFFALRALQAGASPLRDVLLAGIAAGLAAGTKYNAGIALALPIVAALLLPARPWAWRLRACIVAALACAVTFLLTTPFAILAATDFSRDLHTIARHYATGHAGAEGNDNALWYLSYLWNTGLLAPLTVLAVAGVGVVVARYRRAGLVLLAFVLPYYALLCSTYVRFDRNLLPLLPFLALLAACSAGAVIAPLARLLRNHAAATMLVLAIAALPSAYDAAYAAPQSDFAITHPFSEEVALAWANAHLPAGARTRVSVAIENWEGNLFALSPRHYRITHLSTLAAEPYDWFKSQGIRYIVADSYTDGAYLREPNRYPLQAARYRELFRRGRLLFRVTGNSLLRPGPTMSIYKVR